MASSAELIKKRKEYYNLLENVNTLYRKLNTASNSLSLADKMDNYFTIDNEPADGGMVSSVKTKIENTRNQLSSRIIPSIKIKIDKLSSEIESALNAESKK